MVNKNINYIFNLPTRFLNIAREVGRLADQQDLAVYLVGGVVRDLILGRDIKDLDFVIEGDAIKFARVIALEKEFKMTVYRQFGTATVFWKNNSEIDFVSARKETYEHAGALPNVEMAGLSDDLFRRDFTINTLCLSMNKKSWGKLIDLYGGLDDLGSRSIRILHEKSFQDDPTRILRAVRFAQRLSFRIERRTGRLIKEAVQQKALQKVKWPRLFQELRKNFSEKNSGKQIRVLQKLKVLSSIHPGFKVDNARLEAIEILCKKHSDEKWLLVLMSLVSKLELEVLTEFLEKIQLTKVDQKSVSQSLQVNRVLNAVNKHLIKRSEVYMILNSFQLETVRYFYACARTAGQKKRIRCYLDTDRFKRLDISGDDLKSIGFSDGKEIKDALTAILTQKINGFIKSKSDELQLARKFFRGLCNESNGQGQSANQTGNWAYSFKRNE